ncbi:MAG: hypothetical protein ABEH88_05255 [Halobacteriales archaeon]
MSGNDPPDAMVELEDALEALFRDSHTNAVLAWVLVGILATVFVESALDVDYGWILFVGTVGVIVLIPLVAYRDWRVMLPWELLVLALLPILVRALFGGTVGTFATYLSLAAVALLVIVQLHTFTSLSVTSWFAVGLVVLTTLSAEAAWTIFRWNADNLLGTSFLLDNETLMIEWVYVTLAGLAAGVLFDGYFRRRDRWLWLAIHRAVGR